MIWSPQDGKCLAQDSAHSRSSRSISPWPISGSMGARTNPKGFLGLAGQAGTTSLIQTSWGMGEHLTPLKAAIRAQFKETLC